jgi:hypothetical protein
MEHLDVQRVRPPVAVRVSAAAVRERALARAFVSLCVHIVSNRRVLSDYRFAPEGGTLVAEHDKRKSDLPIDMIRGTYRCTAQPRRFAPDG